MTSGASVPFCFNCGKEVDSEWVSCPFCSTHLPQVQVEDTSDNEEVWEEILDSRNGTPTGDWSSVFHNGELIESIVM